MMMLAAVTMTVHVVEETLVRADRRGGVARLRLAFNFQWPSLLYVTGSAVPEGSPGQQSTGSVDAGRRLPDHAGIGS
jgi:hypothetical protein